MNYKYILFDLDGTLTDPKEGITKSVQYSLHKMGIEEQSLDDLEKFIGPPLKDSFTEFYSFTDEMAIEAINYYREYFKEKGIFQNKLYEGITDLLDAIKSKECIIAVATSKPTVFAENILDYFGLTKYFNLIVGSNLDGSRSSKSEIIKHVLDELNIKDLTDVVMIGDRKHDVIGAQNNKIDSIGVLYGYGSKEEIEDIKPTYIVNSISKLYKLLVKE